MFVEFGILHQRMVNKNANTLTFGACMVHVIGLFSTVSGTRSNNNNDNNERSTMAGGPAEMKVLGMLWKQAATGIAIGASTAFVYYQAVTKQDATKIEAYYTKQDAAAKQ